MISRLFQPCRVGTDDEGKGNQNANGDEDRMGR